MEIRDAILSHGEDRRKHILKNFGVTEEKEVEVMKSISESDFDAKYAEYEKFTTAGVKSYLDEVIEKGTEDEITIAKSEISKLKPVKVDQGEGKFSIVYVRAIPTAE